MPYSKEEEKTLTVHPKFSQSKKKSILKLFNTKNIWKDFLEVRNIQENDDLSF